MRFKCSQCACVLDLDDCVPGELVACGRCNAAVSVPLSPVSPGAVLGDFAIIKEIGEGGMGKVYLAHQLSLDRQAALKILNGGSADGQTFIQNFVNEARMAAALNHPNIVQAYAVDFDSGHYYFAMEMVEGNTLKQILQSGGRMHYERVLAIASDIFSAMDYAWREKRLIHRDIKPDNIILTLDGRTKLADLGLARRMSEAGDESEGELFGTPQYIAPELLVGAQADLRSDIYSLGATLYQALTGQIPYNSHDISAMVMMHLNTPLPPPRSLAADLPAEVALLVEIMLAKRPGQRYQNYSELLADLKLVRSGKMPERKLPADAQQPIDINLPDPLGLAAEATAGADADQTTLDIPMAEAAGHTSAGKPGLAVGAQHGGKISLGKGKKGGVQPAGGVHAEPASGAAEPAETEEEGEDEAEKPAKSRIPWLWLGLATLVVAGLAGGGAMFMLRGDPAASGTAAGTTPESAAPSGLSALRARLTAGAKLSELQGELQQVALQITPGHPEYQDYLNLIAPHLEGELQARRESRLEETRAGWKNQLSEAQAELAREVAAAQAEDERLAREKAAEAERRRLEKEAQALAEKLEAEKQELRGRIVTYCRKADFSGAKIALTKMQESSQESEREWAARWDKIISQAEMLYGLVRNSREKLAGVVLMKRDDSKNRNIKRDWKVDSIVLDRIAISMTRKVRARNGKEVEEVEKDMLKLDTLPPLALLPLAAKALELEGLSMDLSQIFGHYLLVRGDVDAARQQLEAAGLSEEMTAELPLVKTAVEALAGAAE